MPQKSALTLNALPIHLPQLLPAAAPLKIEPSQRGLLIAGVIMTTWAVSLVTLLRTTPGQHPFWQLFAVLWQTFLYAGLFITAHDAMHGVVAPGLPKLNRFVGSLALLIYGLFSYDQLLKAHCQHHKHPASELDPDFHNGRHKNAFAWYFNFLQRYWSWRRLLALIASFHAMHLLLHIPGANLVLFWIVPSLLSSVQLFYFGTYLPHREPVGGYRNVSRAQSVYRPIVWSFLACYHFGYHREHHEHPDAAWWQLPAIVKQQ